MRGGGGSKNTKNHLISYMDDPLTENLMHSNAILLIVENLDVFLCLKSKQNHKLNLQSFVCKVVVLASVSLYKISVNSQFIHKQKL